ncbi:MAG: DUF6878 family protein [Verrucomicrobiota bacterium]
MTQDNTKNRDSASLPKESYMDNLRRILPMLREHKVERISVRFAGYGDTGSIEEISYFPTVKADIHNRPIRYKKFTSSFNSDIGWTEQLVETTGPLDDAIESLSYDYIQETGVDWYNNEGGFGELIVDVVAGSVSLSVSVNQTYSITEFSAIRDILTGEEVD